MLGLILIFCAHAAAIIHTSQASCRPGAFKRILDQYSLTLNTTHYANNTYTVGSTNNTVPFCAVDAVIPYGQNDSLSFSLWLPDMPHYGQRFVAVGNGALAGIIDYSNMINQLNAGLGFAVAGGDAGHTAALNNNGIGKPGLYLPFLHDPDQTKAWIHDAISIFTPVAKAMVTTFYHGRKAKHAYFNGCSTGGAQGFALAQYHPELYDGIVAGSPGNWYSHLALSFLWNAKQTATSASQLSQDTLNLITNAVLKACDGNDGVVDGLIENPLNCTFDINSLACAGSTSNCLTTAQLNAVKAIYQGPVGNGRQIYPGFTLGSEREWGLQEGYLANSFSIPILQNLVYNDLNYNASSFDFNKDVGDVDIRAGTSIDERGNLSYHGKILVTQGWSDPFNAATWPIEYQKSQQFELFMIPGGGHCGAALQDNSVPAQYHTMGPLVEWVERGQMPEELLSTNPPDGSDRTRLLCPWPKTAAYVAGDKDQSTSYVCS